MRGFCDVLADHYLWPNLLQQFKSFFSVCTALWSKWLFMNFFFHYTDHGPVTSTPNARAVLCLLYAMMRHNYILATSFSIFAFIWYSLNGYVVLYRLCLTQPLTSIEQLSPVQFSGCCCFEQRQINWTNFFASTQATQQRNILFLWYVTFNTCFQILLNEHQLILRKSVVGSAFLNWINPPQIHLYCET